MKYVDNSSGIRDSLGRWGSSNVVIGGIASRRWGAKRPEDGISEEGGVQMLQLFTGLQTWWAELKERASEERGATAVEYALMVALIAVVIIVAVTFLGESASDKFQQVGDAVAST
ncbi:MAG TPA: Flp family type IVb pilin [Actinomycetota bacterium]|nr:Flp family type IVb pilin [Actinomycetota bacterium]